MWLTRENYVEICGPRWQTSPTGPVGRGARVAQRGRPLGSAGHGPARAALSAVVRIVRCFRRGSAAGRSPSLALIAAYRSVRSVEELHRHGRPASATLTRGGFLPRQ